MGLLKVVGADLSAGNVCGDGEDGHTAAIAVEQTIDEVEIAGPQLAAQTASEPVRCASAPAANAATSSLRTWTHSMVPSLRRASVKPLSESPGKP